MSVSGCGIDLPHRVPPPPTASDREEGGGEQSRVPEAREGKPLEGASTIYCVGSEVSHPPLVAVMRVQYLKVIIITSGFHTHFYSKHGDG